MKADGRVEVTHDGRGVLFWVRVVPGASRQGIVGWQTDGRLRVRVSSPPEHGRANRALLRLLAGHMGVKSSALTIVAGGNSREKRIHVDGVRPDRVTDLGQGEE
jgi:uncharacterized protein (TIGR00251 family)